ncbi:CopG family transcriptional regulator [Leptospira fluminis]|uniref:CopG family transcriptional regulator n=1 Tax=Leptospira fluminis TaxID=2484979 RepID=A0A4R9GRZ4_9LEPT|nr:CopG family transcriptional regulator [Leptospira fluminis]TGK20934.1 CopG family transcriptional regulator [Leptospira fluminis]
MARVERRFQMLLTEEEFELLRKEAGEREMSASELLRTCFRNEIFRSDTYRRLEALKELTQIYSGTEI